MQVSKFLRKGADGYLFYCPGCEDAHKFRIGGDGARPQWTFNGNVDCPSFTPSLLHYTVYRSWTEADGLPRRMVRVPEGQRVVICHLFVTDGKVIFCNDNPHKLNGQTVPLPELPEFMQGDGYGDGNP